MNTPSFSVFEVPISQRDVAGRVDVMDSLRNSSSQTRSHVCRCRGEITSTAHFDGEECTLSLSHTLILTLYTAHPPDSCSVPHSWNRQLTGHQNQTTHTGSRTHLSDLVQQLVVLLPFLQGAQIATHPSCQGNGAVVPLECARFSGCCAACVCARALL